MTIIFTHIPKTAGTSWLQALIDPVVPATKQLRFRGIRSIWGRRTWQATVVYGHAPYGIHRFGIRQPRYATLLRQPLDRAISEYYFIRQSSYTTYQHPLFELAMRLNIVDFFARDKRDNLQTRYLAGWPWDRLNVKPALVLPLAKSNLAGAYACFGLQERFAESLRQNALALDLAAPNGELPREKVTLERPAPSELSASEHAGLDELHQCDLDLYAFAQNLFVERLKNGPGQAARAPLT